MKNFGFYEIVAVIIPGAVLLFGSILFFFPDHTESLKMISSLSVGGLGLGLIFSYVVGQLLQVFENWFESLYWKLWGGKPTDWVRNGKRNLLSPTQRTRVEQCVSMMQGKADLKLSSLTAKEWYSITREIDRSLVKKDSSKVYVFNAHYGFSRGMAIVFLLLLILHFAACQSTYLLPPLLLAFTCLAVLRMHRFGCHYAREVFVQYLQAQNEDSKGEVK